MIYEGDNMMGIKRTNRSAALWLLHERGSMSRKRLAESTKLTPAAITKIVGEMIADGLVCEGEPLPGSGVGRREVTVELNSRARCALGVLINLRQAILSAVWLDGSVIFSEELVLEPQCGADDTVRQLSARLMELAEQNRLKRELIIGLGTSLPTVGPGSSARMMCMECSPPMGSTAMMKISTPMPPIHSRKLRQNSPARLSVSTSFTTDAPVVVNPDTVSNTASA